MKLSRFGLLLSLALIPGIDAGRFFSKIVELLGLHDEKFQFELSDKSTGNCFQVTKSISALASTHSKDDIKMTPCDLTDPSMKFTYHFKTKTFRSVKYPKRCLFLDTQSTKLCSKDCNFMTTEETKNSPFDFDAKGRIVAHNGMCVSPAQHHAETAPCSGDPKQVFEVESEVDLPLDKIAQIVNSQSSGDPHFSLWNGTSYDFHGGCDLVMIDNPDFSDGLGMRVHIRTKIHDWWSSIEAAVVQIGNETLEVMAGDRPDGWYWLNGEVGEVHWEPSHELSLSGFPVHYSEPSEKIKRIRIDLGFGDAVGVQTFKDMVQVNLHAHLDRPQFTRSVGLMGSFPEGNMYARDRFTLMDNDVVGFGKEWQVRGDEPMLFHQVDGVQWPQTCAMPDSDAAAIRKKRRLGESLLTSAEAAEACAHVEAGPDYKNCIFDVLATNDLEVAEGY